MRLTETQRLATKSTVLSVVREAMTVLFITVPSLTDSL